MTNTTPAPTDAEILDAAKSAGFCFLDAGYAPTLHTTPHQYSQKCFERFARAILTKWGAPAPASGEPVMWAYKYADGTWHDASATEHSAGMRPLYAAAPPAQEARVPLSAEQQRCIEDAHKVAACEEYFSARPHVDCSVNRRIFEAGFSKGYGITAAQKETP